MNSRLGLTKLHFAPYTKDQIELIIGERLRALPAFGDGAVELAARKIASISGDMRRALQICRRAAEICEEQIARSKINSSKGTAAALDAVASADASADTSHLVTAEHITLAISDLQSSSFIQWLRVRAPRVPFEPLMLAAMMACMKFAVGGAPSAAAAAVGRGGGGGGDDNPVVTLESLLVQASALLDTKGYLSLVASRAGLTAAHFPKPSAADLQRLVQQWADVRLVQLAHVRGEREPRLQLNVLTDDIEHAYLHEPLWDHLRN